MAKERYSGGFGINVPPVLTLVGLVATITFLVLGWYGFHNVVLSIIAWAVAIFTVLAIFGKRFHAAFEKGLRLRGGRDRLPRMDNVCHPDRSRPQRGHRHNLRDGRPSPGLVAGAHHRGA